MTVGPPPLRDVDDALEHDRQARRSRRTGRPSRGESCDSTAGVRIGLALPQYDFSVAGESPLTWETLRGYAHARRRRRLRLALAVGPPLLRHRQVRRQLRAGRARTSRSSTLGALAQRRASAARLGTLVHLRGAAPGDGAGQGARVARPDHRRSARRRARRGLVRARVRGDRDGLPAARACASPGSPKRSRS